MDQFLSGSASQFVAVYEFFEKPHCRYINIAPRSPYVFFKNFKNLLKFMTFKTEIYECSNCGRQHA